MRPGPARRGSFPLLVLSLALLPAAVAGAAFFPGPESAYTRHFGFAAALGDFDEDGHPDVILGDTFLRVATGNGEGLFEIPPVPEVDPQDGISQVVVVDLDGDGHLDLAGPGAPPPVALGRGDGSFARL